MKRPIRIIIPHYQKQSHLRQLLNILNSQLYGNSEIIIVDDYSPDPMPELCDKAKVIRPSTPRKEQYRLNHLRSLGVKTAKNDCIIILDPDCHPVSDKFTEHASKIFDPVIIYGGRIDYINEDGSIRIDDSGS